MQHHLQILQLPLLHPLQVQQHQQQAQQHLTMLSMTAT